MPDAVLVIDGARMAELLRSPTGPIGRHMIERATRVQMAAKAQAPHKTGCLADSIVKRIEETPLGIAVRIVSDTTPCSPSRTSYSLFVHEGTAPHQIVARNAQALRFEIGGQVIFVQSVNHPGTKPNRFLADNLHLATI